MARRSHFYGNLNFDIDKTLYFFTAGRREYTNKGVDMFLEALARVRRLVVVVFADVFAQLNAMLINDKSETVRRASCRCARRPNVVCVSRRSWRSSSCRARRRRTTSRRSKARHGAVAFAIAPASRRVDAERDARLAKHRRPDHCRQCVALWRCGVVALTCAGAVGVRMMESLARGVLPPGMRSTDACA